MLASRTDAVEFQTMAFDGETVFPGNFVLEFFNAWIFEFDDFATGHAD